MNSDWNSEEEETELFSSSLHIPINPAAKKEYEAWIEKDCDKDWWYHKEMAKKKENLINVGYIID